ncbi:uncharacterized protein F4822DRAFT_414172 [Hypoxylon trugodes]|uniref:uncharacterized protein n=1 Tax=Hypoxylon trugodes TaxID=326681 RepID=UPI002199829E|nr:uncharacterized protein F4822DRAFT_414172 [Hypoxylon trugodes]KAI1385795.1 hypothetical protein F4822DRAFT_414172 [Hypoxylon trugodes]
MYAIRSSLLATLFWALCVFQVTAVAAENADSKTGMLLALRQNTAAVSCPEYSMVANYSTIGSNSTYRAAFQQSSPLGTFQSNAIMDGATAKLPQFINNKAINDACGNLTQIAITEAANNFTRGIVANFNINAGIKNSGELGMVVTMVLATVGVLSFL